MDSPAIQPSEKATEGGVSQQKGAMVKEFQPRSYQIEVFEVARKRNTIAVLDTGSGKTVIALMLIREVGRAVREKGEKVLIVFLAPTVDLVHQQYEVIRDHVEFSVAEYYGAKGVDEWNASCWAKEISTNEVMVMTPQILLDALRHGFMAIDMVQLLIFDECHRANGNHPYTKIMKDFFHKLEQRPAIFGMTASPVIRKGVSSATDCENQISELESLLDAKIFTIKDRAEVEQIAPPAKELHRYYDPNTFCFEELKTKLEAIRAKTDASLINLQESPSNQFKDINDTLKALRKSLYSYHEKILYCLDTLGLICAHEAAEVCKENVSVLNCVEEHDFSKASTELYISYLEEVLHIIEEDLQHGPEKCIYTECAYLDGNKIGVLSPKLEKLVQIIQSFGSSKETLCLIFVERIITAKVLDQFMKKFSNLFHFSTSYLTGGNSSKDALNTKMRQTTLDMFRAGKVNLMFATDVAEEGIDIPNCGYVIRFDLPKTVRSYVQSRGRARQNNSHCVLMLERGNAEQRDQLYDFIRSEFFVINSATRRDPTACLSKLHYEEKDAYHIKSTGATITADSSVGLIYKYCEKLPKDRFFIPKPKFELCTKEGLYECTLTLPPNAAFQSIVSPLSRNAQVAKQLASLEACKKLHELGELNDRLLPIVKEPPEIDTSTNKAYDPGAGTTKRKELHGTTRVHALSGTWADKTDNIILNAYRINFVCDQGGENYSGFVLLLEAVLDDDVACLEIELFLVPNKIVKCSVSPCGIVKLTVDQIEKSKLFQQFFFNGIFGKVFTRSGSSGIQREFLFKEGRRMSWSSTSVYLLLPLQSSSLTNCDALNIHWEGVDACSSVVKYLTNIYSMNCENRPRRTEQKRTDIIHLANKSVNFQYLRDSVVLAIHTGRIYSILDVMNEITSESPFNETNISKQSHSISFKDYYRQKYNIVLQHPWQPLLLLKQSHNPHNLFLPKSKFEDTSTGQSLLAEKEQVHASIPPELLVYIDISTDILKSFYLLPSVMYRLESLMLASQLRDEIGCDDSTCHVSSSLILEAITTSRCCENFSLERLELLGDSVLKYALSCDLFLKYPKKHEGQLSDRRSSAVRNSTLHKMGTSRHLQGYIRDSAFDPRRWVAPGQISLCPFPCNCGVNTSEVPLQRTYVTEDISVVVGKACDKGHRWMCSKTIADCVEALIGAYYVGGHLPAALSLMKWLGIDANFEQVLIEEAKINSSHWCHPSKVDDIEALELKLDYKFSIRGLLLEAITHPSQQELGIGYCYQRLEFLGDAALDLVITWHLYRTYSDIDPGELTDLRSASVSNENFAQAAVRHDFQRYLQHGSGILSLQIKDYVKCISEYEHDTDCQLNGVSKGPKALGDIMESIAGAILLDTGFNLEKVWGVFKPILSPIVTPDKLALPPLRELIELCSFLGYFIKSKCTKVDKEVVAELTVQLKDDLLVGHGHDRNRKEAKAQAAICVLKELKKRGFLHKQYPSKRKQCDDKTSRKFYYSALNFSTSMPPNDSEYIESHDCKKPKVLECSLQLEPLAGSFVEENCGVDDHFSKLKNSNLKEPVTLPVKLQKGGPRTALFELCRIHQWPMPKFESAEQKFRTPVILNGVETPNFNMFTSSITLHIPNTTVIELEGEGKTDKKSSQDSAALAMLRELQKQGRCIIEEQ